MKSVVATLAVLTLCLPALSKPRSPQNQSSGNCVLSGYGSIVCGGRLLSPVEKLPAPVARPIPTDVPLIPRDSRGRILRSMDQRAAFMHQSPCPANGRTYGSCPGYIIDHVMPLACGGPDDPSNMQWQTKADAAAKDKWERKLCGGQ